MVLNRVGAKSKKNAAVIRSYFLPHKTYIEPFFGAGKMFFYKKMSAYNILNDYDREVINFWNILKDHEAEFIQEFSNFPLHEGLFKDWKDELPESEMMRAIRFLFLSNFSYLGKMDTMHFRTNSKSKQLILKQIEQIRDRLKYCLFQCTDFRNVIDKIAFENKKNRNRDLSQAYIYNDPPYFGRTNTYDCPKWTKKDLTDLIEINIESKIPFSISEYDHPVVLKEAEKKNLNIIYIGDRKTMNTKRTEILITNYKTIQLDLFDN